MNKYDVIILPNENHGSTINIKCFGDNDVFLLDGKENVKFILAGREQIEEAYEALGKILGKEEPL